MSVGSRGVWSCLLFNHFFAFVLLILPKSFVFNFIFMCSLLRAGFSRLRYLPFVLSSDESSDSEVLTLQVWSIVTTGILHRIHRVFAESVSLRLPLF